jgi:glycosyltransferase A (GT-A) superfamily protein (DUF2064 family)
MITMDNGDKEKKRTVLAIYCRHPETKRVKTRLARGIGSTEARLFYSGCLESLRHDLSILQRRFDIAICPSDAKDTDWARSYFLEHDHVIPQIYGNLGLRIEHTDLTLRCQGYEKVILIGSDAPSLPIRFVEDVDNYLSRVDVVLGPCSDGGIYAIGSGITLLPMRDIPWGTEAVFSGLLEKYKHEGINVGTTSSWYDVDRMEDLAIALEDLMRSSQKHRNVLGELIGEILSSAAPHGVEQVGSSRLKANMCSCHKNGGEE